MRKYLLPALTPAILLFLTIFTICIELNSNFEGGTNNGAGQ